MIPVLGTSCGLLAAAALCGGMRPVVTLPQADDADVTVVDSSPRAAEAPAPFVGGPLAIPSIGVVAPGFDEEYAALPPAPPPPLPAPTPAEELLVPTEDPSPPPPADPVEPAPPAPPQPPEPPVDPAPPPAPATESPTGTPPTETPPVEPTPTGTPPVEPTPTGTPPVEPTPTGTPPVEPPPAEEPPADVPLALGETYDVLDDAGALRYSVAVDEITVDVPCTAGPGTAENGHLVGLVLRVVTGPAARGDDRPIFDPAAFGVAGATSEPAVVATQSAAGCLTDAEEFPSTRLRPERTVTGTLVLDLPAATGTIAYRPTADGAALLWEYGVS